METKTAQWTLGQLAEILGGELRGPAEHPVAQPAPAHADDPLGLAFASSESYLRTALASGVGAVIVPRETPPIEKPAIAVDDPRGTFGRFLAMCQRPLPIEPGIHPTAVVAPSAVVEAGASVGAYAVVEAGARIDGGSKVYPFAYIGENCHIGRDCTIYPHAVLYQDVRIGARSIVHAGAVLGADGFGFVWNGSSQIKIPQVGGVELGESVEVGALTAIDRATAGSTTVGEGTKLDNLIQVGHNTSVGKHTVIAALVGISGSSVIGNRVTLGGQVALSDHVRIGDDIVMGGRTGVTRDVLEPGSYWGLPARPFGEAVRIQSLTQKLPSLVERLKTLEKRVAELEKEENA